MDLERIHAATHELSGRELVALALSKAIGRGPATRLVKAASRVRARTLARAEPRRLLEMRLETLVPVTEPLALLAPVHGSGGWLLARLLDAHRQCHGYPFELPLDDRRGWPSLDTNAGPRRWSRRLAAEPTPDAEGEAPFLFVPTLARAILDRSGASRTADSPRRVLDDCFTAFFNAWVDNQNLYGRAKRLVTAPVAPAVMEAPSLERFFEAYPDGRLVAIVQSPASWHAAGGAAGVPDDLAGQLEAWTASCRAVLDARHRHGGRVSVVDRDALVCDTERTMQTLAERLGIDFAPSLVTPTFNGLAVRPRAGEWLVAAHPGRGGDAPASGALPTGKAAALARRAGTLYDEVLSLGCRP